MGVANLRGNLCGVVDLAAFMGRSMEKPRTELMLSQCWLVAFNPLLETNSALLVDQAFCLCNKIASIIRYIIQIAEVIRVKKNIVIASPVPQKLCGLIKAKEILMATIISPTKTNIR